VLNNYEILSLNQRGMGWANRLHAELALCAAFLGDKAALDKVDHNGINSENTQKIIEILRKWYALQSK